MSTVYDDVTHYSTAETAAFVRAALGEHFAGVRFSVRSQGVTSMTAPTSIMIEWIDGPTSEQVDKVVDQYRGSDWSSEDGGDPWMRPRELVERDGRLACYGAAAIKLERHVSPSAVVGLGKAEVSARLADCEAAITAASAGGPSVGKALETISREHLYRDRYKSFEGYCKARWGWTKRQATRAYYGIAI